MSLRGPPLVGRDEDIERIRRFLCSWGGCVVIGAGGVGKTSVAVTVAAGFEAVEWIDAETLDRAGAVNAALLDRLDPLPLGDRAPALQALLGGRRVLVVIDGAEGLGVELSDLVRGFPASATGPWLLVTSRLLPFEAGLPVVRLGPSMSTSPAASPRRSPPSVTATWQREAYRNCSSATPRRPGDWPWHPAAFRQSSPSPRRGPLGGFDTGPEGVEHRTVDAVFDTSITRSLQLLDADSAQLLLAMGAAADHVPHGLAAALSGLPPDRLTGALEALARHALITPAPRGLTMLPPVRRSVRRHASRAGVSRDVDERHRRWCLAQVAGPAARAAGRLVADEAEIRSAIRRSVVHPDGFGDAAAMAVALASDFTTVLQHRRALELLESVVDMAGGATDHATSDDLINLLGLAAAVSATVVGAGGATPFIERAEALLPRADAADVHRARLLCLPAELDFDRGDLAGAADRAG